jgi:lipid-binding SYLF domain-containing protein
MQRCAFVVAAVLATGVNANAAIGSSETARLAAAAKVVQDIHTVIPSEYWNKARCVAVIPDLKKAAFIVGGEYGRGVMSCRSGDRWSPPVFMQMTKGNWGFQAGAEQVDVVMLVMNEQGVQKLLQNKVTLGADASIAAGPIGREGHVGTDAALSAEILAYSRAQGLFAGIDLSGGVLRPDGDANASVYGSGASARTILASREISAPTQAQGFLQALNAQSVPAAATDRPTDRAGSAADRAGSVPPTARNRTVSTTDDDLRARVVDIQQTIDRLLADTTPSPVGTSGTTGATGATASGTVAVDRARLLQLRQQLDSLLAALNRR